MFLIRISQVRSSYGVFVRNASHPQPHTYTPELSRSPGPASLTTRLGRWTQIKDYERNECNILFIVVGGIPWSPSRLHVEGSSKNTHAYTSALIPWI